MCALFDVSCMVLNLTKSQLNALDFVINRLFISCSKQIIYRVNLKMSQHENYDISEMREYFCTY